MVDLPSAFPDIPTNLKEKDVDVLLLEALQNMNNTLKDCIKRIEQLEGKK